MVKTIWFLKRRSDMSPADFHRYWRDKHGPLFCDSSSGAVLCPSLRAKPRDAGKRGDDRRRLRRRFGDVVPLDRGLSPMNADPEFQKVVIADGENFLDPTATKQLMCFAEESFDIPVNTS